MSFQIDTAFVKQYHDNVERLLQQMGSKLRSAVRVESQKGEEAFWEQIGSVSAQEVTSRHADSPLMSTPHDRRRVTLRTFDVGDMVDDFDKVKMLIDPTSVYVQNFVDAISREMDKEIIRATFDTAFTGKSGGTSTTFPAGNIIAVDFSTTGTNTNLTINKLIEARRLLLSNFNEAGRKTWYVACSANNLMSLLKSNQVQSADYNTVRALVRGEIDTFLGFKFITSEFLQATGNNRKVQVWVEDGILMSLGKDIVTRVAERPDKRFSVYAYACAQFGATRMQENKVVQILCDETK